MKMVLWPGVSRFLNCKRIFMISLGDIVFLILIFFKGIIEIEK